MRASDLALRLVAASCALLSVSIGACAEGGLSNDQLNANMGTGDSPDEDAGTSSGSGKDARANGDDDPPNTGSGGTKDASTGNSGGNKDASTGNSGGSKDASTGSTGAGAPIKCPSPMVCNTSLAGILSIVDPSIKSTDNLCASSGGLLPSAVSCSSVDVCKSSRLTTATCSGGSCIQPCTP